MKISIIIPVFNEDKEILSCIKSLSGQSEKDFEIIVVDDGSTDKTLEVLESLKPKVKNLKVLRENHRGAGAARNLGAKKAKGNILVFVDADMTFDKDFIRNLVKPIETGVAIGTFSKEELLANKDNIWAVCWNLNRGLPKDRMHSFYYPDKQKVFRAILKKKFDEAGGFDIKGGYTDDWTLSEKLGVLAANAPNAVFYHKNPGSLSEVFRQSKWMAKRKYKFGIIGIFVALIRVSFPVSLINGIFSSIRFLIPQFFVFKIVSDFAQFIGILEYQFGKVSK